MRSFRELTVEQQIAALKGLHLYVAEMKVEDGCELDGSGCALGTDRRWLVAQDKSSRSSSSSTSCGSDSDSSDGSGSSGSCISSSRCSDSSCSESDAGLLFEEDVYHHVPCDLSFECGVVSHYGRSRPRQLLFLTLVAATRPDAELNT